jgi:hypothetical protein
MGNDLWSYLERLEFLGFFSAYPLVFALVHVIAGYGKKGIIKKLPSLLPYAYGLVGILYLGLQLKNLYPDYSFEHINAGMEQPFLKIWALLSILFLIPALAKKPVISLLHSFVFFFFLLKDILWSGDKNIVSNDMKVYTDSLLINSGAMIVMTIIYLLIRFILKNKTPNN